MKTEPPVEGFGRHSRICVEAFPRKTTSYTLTAGDKSGKTVSASLTVAVR